MDPSLALNCRFVGVGVGVGVMVGLLPFGVKLCG